jgi:hypothetical protein
VLFIGSLEILILDECYKINYKAYKFRESNDLWFINKGRHSLNDEFTEYEN